MTKDYYEAHKEEIRAKQKEYNLAHREENNARAKAWNQAHKEERKAYKNAHREEHKAYKKAYDKAHREEYKAYQKSDTNSAGIPKRTIRINSYKYLFNTLGFQQIGDYEDHHCFGYETEKEFIYIPKWLHKSVIHPFLRKNNIDADTDHFEQIKHLLDSCKEKIYIIKDGKVTEY